MFDIAIEGFLVTALGTCAGLLLVGLSYLFSRKPAKKNETVTNKVIYDFLYAALDCQHWSVGVNSLQCLAAPYKEVKIHKASRDSKPTDVYFFVGTEIVNDRIAGKDLALLKDMAKPLVERYLNTDVSLQKIMAVIETSKASQ